MVNEKYIAAIKNAVKDVKVKIPNDEMPDDVNDIRNAVKIVITFGVTTDSEAWLTVHGNGRVTTAFGGTGLTDQELKSYIDHGINIYRSITGDEDTDFHRPAIMAGP